MKFLFRSATIGGFALVMALAGTDLACARGPGGPGFGGPGFGGPGFGGHGAAFGPTTYPHGFTQGRRTGWRGGSVPPGWSKGHKNGWQGRGVPPGWRGF
jgi:hypothetical protein